MSQPGTQALAGQDGRDASAVIARAGALSEALRRARDPRQVLDAIGEAVQRTLGPGLLTVNAWHAASAQIERLWSSDPEAYPVGGGKTKGDTAWRRQLLDRGELFVGEGDAALAEVFDDVQLIRSLGCTAVVNVPLCDGGRVIGTLNYLAARSTWPAGEVAALSLFGAIATAPVRDLLAARR